MQTENLYMHNINALDHVSIIIIVKRLDAKKKRKTLFVLVGAPRNVLSCTELYIRTYCTISS